MQSWLKRFRLEPSRYHGAWRKNIQNCDINFQW
ncbi:protein of unknown function [Pseudomonas inefficax]|uniref:Uncharacterized protein n=1 Tax=Pseudomonas inefficax TaxID=2078786 RepID=A0AAQ1PG43_9PSED|nr:protein of unknown function [Pseudomonas inefficax]